MRERAGRRAETLACWWLRLHGWRIVARRLALPQIEIDIVAVRGATLAFVEVKHRATIDAAVKALNAQALARMLSAADAHGPALAARHGARNFRCDMIATAPRSLPHHLAKLR
jgi:putative endonuclease